MEKPIIVAIAGSPNSGKTTIFNNLTGATQHVGNYPGVTVEKKLGEKYFKGNLIRFIDLPGTYSLTAYSEEEIVARNFIIEEKPDLVINVIDSSSLERNLYLTTQLIELEVPLILVFNMTDIFEKRGMELNMSQLSKLLGAAIIQTVGSKNKGMEQLLETIIRTFKENNKRKKIIVNYGDEIENEIKKIIKVIESNKKISGKIELNLRWVSIKLLEQDAEIIKKLKFKIESHVYDQLEKQVIYSINHIKNILRDSPETLIAQSRYGFINGALMETVKIPKLNHVPVSDRIDQFVTHAIFGLPIFALIIWIIFQIVFRVGDYPSRWLGIGFAKLSQVFISVMPAGLLRSMITDGIIGGVGGILVFTPKIILLFISIALLEDSGYMARAAFIMDRVMHKIGLHGKSFIPMLIGFGCSIPAYMCSRTLENKNDRLITMHINTFMSCGGRLPIYILFAGIFFPSIAGNIIFSIYLIGIVMAVLMAKFLRVTRFRGEAEPFVMELPPYRVPTLKSILIHTWERTWLYLKKAGTIILAFSIIMWIMFTFPRIGNNYSKDYNVQLSTLKSSYDSGIISESVYNSEVSIINTDMSAERLEYSAAGKIGHFIEPVFKPLGFDWRLALASVTGIAGKEVVVSTMGTLFSLSKNTDSPASLNNTIASQYNPLIGYNFMIFSLLYFPCVAGLAVFKKEAGTKEMLFQIGYTLALAWIVAFTVFQIGRLFL